MSNEDQEPFSEIYNLDLSQYPNLTADFNYDQGNLFHSPTVMPEPVYQHQTSSALPLNVNLLSFQPMSQVISDPPTHLLLAPIDTSHMASNATAILGDSIIMTSHSMQQMPVLSSAITLPQGTVLSQTSPSILLPSNIPNAPSLQNEMSPPNSTFAILSPDAFNPPTQLLMNQSLLTPKELIPKQLTPTELPAKEPKQRKPRTPKKKPQTVDGDPSQQVILSPSSKVSKEKGPKELKDYVQKLLEKQTDNLAEKDFAERALLNLAKKLSSRPNMLVEWCRAIESKDPNTSCVTVSRPKDGRMTITKTCGGSTCKKVFPQILVCQLFRWPKIVFHNDIKSAEICQCPGSVKPPVLPQSNAQSVPDNSAEDLDTSGSSDMICINPYHYVMTPEAEARFRKADAKSQKAEAMQAKLAAKAALGISNSLPLIEELSQNSVEATKSKIEHTKELDPIVQEHLQPEPMEPESSGDESESSDDVFSMESEDEIDFVKMWETEAVEPKQQNELLNFDEETMMEEIKFLSFKNDQNELTPTEPEVLEKLKMKEEIREYIFGGKIFDCVFKRDSTVVSEKRKPKNIELQISSVETVQKATESESPKKTEEIVKAISTSQESGVFRISPSGEEDNSICDILEDIRGSFERQFEDQFQEFSPSNLNQQESHAGVFFNTNDGDGSNLLDIDPSVTDEMPCIINAWTMPGGDSSELVDSQTISQEAFEDLFNEDQNMTPQFHNETQTTNQNSIFPHFDQQFQHF